MAAPSIKRAVSVGGCTRIGKDTVLAQIIELVRLATVSKALQVRNLPIGLLVMKVPVVIAISLFSFLGWWLWGGDFNMALITSINVLVISCPCALGLATPTSIMVATGLAAQHGILFKSAESLETARMVKTVVFDKTGTQVWASRCVLILSPSGEQKQKGKSWKWRLRWSLFLNILLPRLLENMPNNKG